MMLADLIKDYVDKAIEHEFARRDVYEDGYTTSAREEENAREDAFLKLKEYLKELDSNANKNDKIEKFTNSNQSI